MSKKWYKSPEIIAIIVIVGLLLGLMLGTGIKYTISQRKSDVDNATVNEIVDKTTQYQVASYVLKNNGEEKIEKIIIDKNASSYEMEEVYKEREVENSDYEYTIWFFSSEEQSQGASTYELGSVTKENGKIETINVKEEKEEEELAKQREEELQEQKRKEEEEKEKAEQEEKKYKASCKKLTFEELARNPEKVKGTKVRLTGEVVQVSENNISIGMRVNITENEYGWYEDTVYIIYYPEDGEDKILEDDIITIYGTAEGEYSYTSVMGAYITIPKILAEYIEVN